MQDISTFAGGEGGFFTGDIFWMPYLERTVMQYIENMSVLRNYCKVYPLPQNTWVVKIPRNYPTGIAVEVNEGSEIPRVKQMTDSFEISVIKYGTGGEMTDEAKETDWLGILGQAQIEEAAKRMLRKQNSDIATVLLAGYGTVMPTSDAGKLKYEDIVMLKTAMIKKQVQPNVILCNPDEYADLQVDDRFVDASQAGTAQTLRTGAVGRVAGMELVPLLEIPSGMILMLDTGLNPLWLVERQAVRIARQRDEERQVDSFFMTAYAKPAVVRSDAIGLLVVKSE
jgi:N4-gp56 family major capsid protein